jgi:large subunit ribosomal protein L29
MAKGQSANDLRSKTDAELSEALKATHSSLLTVRFENYTNKLNDTARIGRLRREIAQIKTVQAERSKAKMASKTAAKSEA